MALFINSPILQQIADLTLMGYYRSFMSYQTGTAASEILTGNILNDKLDGGAGDDTLVGLTGDDWLNGGAGKDVLVGGWGHDVANYTDSPDGIRIDLNTGLAADNNPDNAAQADSVGDVLVDIEQINGSIHAAFPIGDGNNNAFYGYDGGDNLKGNGGDDTLYGMEGSDNVDGGIGNDTIHGGGGFLDTLFGGAGEDKIYGEAGDDIIYGGENNDTIEGGAGADQIYGGTGGDTIHGDAGNDIINGGEGVDRIYGGFGDDVLVGGGGDTMIGGAGDDELYADGTALATADVLHFDVFGNNGDDIVYNFDVKTDMIRLEGALISDEALSVSQTDGGWLKLNFEGGGSVTFEGNVALSSVKNLNDLHDAAVVGYDGYVA